MDLIDVPKPRGIRDPNRLAGTLLLAQVRHLHEAEKSLPAKYHSGIFYKAVVTEQDAAHYIRAVTKGIHKAHDDAAKGRRFLNRQPRAKVIELTASAEQNVSRKRPSGAKTKKNKKSKKAPTKGHRN